MFCFEDHLKTTNDSAKEFWFTSHRVDMNILQTLLRSIVMEYLCTHLTVYIPHFSSVFDSLIRAIHVCWMVGKHLSLQSFLMYLLLHWLLKCITVWIFSPYPHIKITSCDCSMESWSHAILSAFDLTNTWDFTRSYIRIRTMFQIVLDPT